MQSAMLLTRLGASELTQSIAAGDVSARAVVDAHIDRILAVDDALNAVVLRRFEEARREADAADAAQLRGEELGPLHGVPVTVKDQFHVTGLPTTFGVSRLADALAPADGPMVAALRRAGAIVLGKTNVPQALAVHETDNAVFGRTSNPWDLARTPGGSSGGDAAIVAAGGVPLSLGADYGGSLRGPAAWCGVATLMPTARRLPCDAAPVRAANGSEGIVAQPGPLARRVADVALALAVMSDAVAAGATAGTPPIPWPDPAALTVPGMRIALLEEIDGYRPAPAVRRALAEAAEALRAAGATVESWDDAPDTSAGVDLALRLYVADGAGWTREVIGSDRPHPLLKADLALTALPNWVLGALGLGLRAAGQRQAARLLRSVRTTSAAGFMRLLGDRLAYQATFTGALDAGGYDAVLCPAMPLPAPPHGRVGELPDATGTMALFNLLGMPAGVVPVTRVRTGEESDRPASRDRSVQAARSCEAGTAGLPVGVQVAARHWREDVVLAVMGAVEHALATNPDYPGVAPPTAVPPDRPPRSHPAGRPSPHLSPPNENPYPTDATRSTR